MPWSTDKKEITRNRILESAVKLFSTKGFDNVSIKDVMTKAQLTHGAFYAHFSSKIELYTESITSTIKHSSSIKAKEMDDCKNPNITQILADYLDIDHIQNMSSPCPLAFLATDIATREKEVRIAYTQVYKNLIATLDIQPNSSSRRKRIHALSALMIGGVAISRALYDEQETLDLLNACREIGEELLDRSDIEAQ